MAVPWMETETLAEFAVRQEQTVTAAVATFRRVMDINPDYNLNRGIQTWLDYNPIGQGYSVAELIDRVYGY